MHKPEPCVVKLDLVFGINELDPNAAPSIVLCTLAVAELFVDVYNLTICSLAQAPTRGSAWLAVASASSYCSRRHSACVL